MSKSKLTKSFKESREGLTQQQLAMELNVSRETISAYETGRARLPQDIAQTLMARKENPRFAFALRNEYTKTGPIWLDGPNADLHRSSVREKTIEELIEVLTTLQQTSFAKPLQNILDWERPNLELLLEHTVEAITSLETLAVIVCEETNISYSDTWNLHYQELRVKGYLS